jgi:DNA replication protein DnaC
MGRRYRPDRVSLDLCESYDPAQVKVLQQIRKVAEDLPNLVEEGQNLIFYGSVGTGKDHMMAALLYQAIWHHGFSVAWLNGLDFYGAIRDRMGAGTNEDQYLRSLVAPTILGISDPIPPLRDPSAWNVETLYRLIDRRYRSRKCTWMTFNASSVDEAEEKLGAPIIDRLQHDAIIFKCYWPSYRELKKNGSQKRPG